MPATTPTDTLAENPVQTFIIKKESRIAAPLEIVFETILESQGPLASMNLKIEPFPGGRWYRDLGNNAGHLWGHVQVIKPPKLLELVGPMMMSYPAVSHLQYRLTQEGDNTLLTLTHRAMGMITPDHATGVNEGWQLTLDAIQASAEAKAKK